MMPIFISLWPWRPGTPRVLLTSSIDSDRSAFPLTMKWPGWACVKTAMVLPTVKFMTRAHVPWWASVTGIVCVSDSARAIQWACDCLVRINAENRNRNLDEFRRKDQKEPSAGFFWDFIICKLVQSIALGIHTKSDSSLWPVWPRGCWHVFVIPKSWHFDQSQVFRSIPTAQLESLWNGPGPLGQCHHPFSLFVAVQGDTILTFTNGFPTGLQSSRFRTVNL